MNDRKAKKRLQPLAYEILVSIVVGALIALVCWGVLHPYFPELTPWIALFAVCVATGFLSWMESNGIVQ